jgi:hypothetical protein
MYFYIHLHLLNGGNIFGVLHFSVVRLHTSVEWNGDVILDPEEWSKNFFFFFDDRIRNSIKILRRSRNSMLKCSFVTTEGPPGDIRGISVLTCVVYSLHEMFFSCCLQPDLLFYHFVKLSNIVCVLANCTLILQTLYQCNARFNLLPPQCI